MEKTEKPTYGNYRICFGGRDISYARNFHACRKMFPTIRKLILASRGYSSVQYIWWFFEPYAEVTWIATDDTFLEEARRIVEEDGYQIISTGTPSDGSFYNWYGSTSDERGMVAYYYASLGATSRFILDNKDDLDNGIGLKNHYGRCLHVLANQQGMNYWHEGVACLKHGILCLSIFFFKPTWVRDFCTKYLHMSSGLFYKE